jgi:hypothetical protein
MSVGAEAELMTRLRTFERMVEASRVIAKALDPFEASGTIIAQCCSVMDADRATLFRLVAHVSCRSLVKYSLPSSV